MTAFATRGLPSLALVLLLLAPGSRALAAGEGSLRGRVTLDIPGMNLEGVGPIVVYLEPVDAASAEAPPTRAARLTQKNATFSPAFLVVTAGQPVDMPNVDAIYHNVFSYSRPNDFDLGMYGGGNSRTVTFRYPGVVKVYCSIHETMNATILVVPSRHFAFAKDGTFSLDGIPPGRYRVRTWCEKLPDTVHEIAIEAGASRSLEISLTPSAA